ncbi:hypothetical protein BDFG_02841 [Blastomyces dermatitidis ATCC 26199]|nr:hypothetical protein BDFG_02841 [Blastomyces dermatitidis ATCC 26199]
MIRFPQRQRRRPTLPKKIEPLPAAAIDSTKQELEAESQRQQQQVERDASLEYPPPLPQKHPRSYIYQASGRVHPRSPSENQSSSSSHKRQKLDEARKREPGKFSTTLSSLDNRSNATAFDDDASFRYAGQPGPSMFGFEVMEGMCGISGFCGRDDDHQQHQQKQTGTARRQDLLAQLRALETRQVELDSWEKSVEDKFAWLDSAREAAEKKLAWLTREEEAMRRMLMWLPDELRVVEERRAQAVRELAATEGRGETVLNPLEGLEGGSGNGKGGEGGEKDGIVTDEEMIG